MVFLPGLVFWRWKNKLNYKLNYKSITGDEILRHLQKVNRFVINKRTYSKINKTLLGSTSCHPF
jgi:hypothetical protein